MASQPGFEPLDFETLPEEQMSERAEAFFQQMRRRRTVRHYSDRPVDRAVIERAVAVAGTAPSGAHKQPWHFVAVGDAEIKRRIREEAEIEEKRSYEQRMPQSWLEDLKPMGTTWQKPYLEVCPWLILVFAKQYDLESDGTTKRKNYYVQESVGIAVGFLLAALHQAGLATLTHTPSPMGFLSTILQRPPNERAYMLIATGHPEEGCQVPRLRRKPLEEILSVV